VKGGPIFASIGVVVSLLLATRTGARYATDMAAVIGLAAVHWWLVRAKPEPAPGA
jgi:hypothetical protein